MRGIMFAQLAAFTCSLQVVLCAAMDGPCSFAGLCSTSWMGNILNDWCLCLSAQLETLLALSRLACWQRWCLTEAILVTL